MLVSPCGTHSSTNPPSLPQLWLGHTKSSWPKSQSLIGPIQPQTLQITVVPNLMVVLNIGCHLHLESLLSLSVYYSQYVLVIRVLGKLMDTIVVAAGFRFVKLVGQIFENKPTDGAGGGCPNKFWHINLLEQGQLPPYLQGHSTFL